VIVSDTVFGYDMSKVSGRKPHFIFRRTSYQASALLHDRVRAFRNNKKDYRRWQQNCLRAGRDEGFDLKRLPELHFGITASGNNVVTSRAFSKELKKQIDSRLEAVEMEAKGLFDAIHHSASETVGLMVRGISDYADTRKAYLEKKSKNFWRRYAAGNAARLVEAVLRRRPTDPLSPPYELNVTCDSNLTDLSEYDILVEAAGAQNLAFSHLIERREPTPALTLEIRVMDESKISLLPDRGVCVFNANSRPERIEPKVLRKKRAMAFSLPRSEIGIRAKLLLAFTNQVKEVEIKCIDEFSRHTKKTCFLGE